MSEDERWKWIAGYEGRYLISNHGRVMGVPNKTHYGHILKQRTIWSGYKSVCLCRENKKKDFAVHRLVANAFIPNPEHKETVNHKDGNRANNRVENLEWATYSENNRHSFRVLGRKPSKPWDGKPRLFARRFTDDQIRAIRSDKRPSRIVGAEYGVSKTTILNIRKRKIYTEVEQCQ